MSDKIPTQYGRKLLRYGILLFLLGLFTGFVIPVMQNPRMGLSSHLEAVMNGMFLLLLGIIWPKLKLPNRALASAFGLALFGTYTNWFTTLLAGLWGAGSEMMPIAGSSLIGAPWQEVIVKFGLVSLSLAMILVSGIVFWGLRDSK